MVTVDITPSPRVLRMLGQIDFQPWQCLAELVDNSIDAFIDQMTSGKPAIDPRINIQLPTDTQLQSGSGIIIIRDNASGMTEDNLKNAVRAGYSGNDPVEKMGLFGMGFNISTARMGRRTEVWTTRTDDPDWIGIVIDFNSLEKQKTFHVPFKKRRKTPSEINEGVHGTEIKISELEMDRVRPLIRGVGKRKTRDRLGKIYGRVMARLGIEIFYDGDRIKPYKHCVWDASRTVDTQAFGRVPAQINIDKKLPPKGFCTICWVWLHEEENTCPSCGHSQTIIERQRRLKGWIGIQRYFDKEHFGIDLIRNGRVIEELDKSFFTFVDENGDQIFEYPIDAVHWGGRIIGELEIDFVRVSHQKDAFDKLDPEWKKVVEIIRGKSPLQPKIAERVGLGKNDSPLARLFAGYRKGNSAGLKDLVPGNSDGSGINSGPIKDYVNSFYNGESAFQSDEKWYELVLLAERGKRGSSAGADDAAGEFPLSDDNESQNKVHDEGNDESENPEVETDSIKSDESIEFDSELSRTYELDVIPVSIPVKVVAYKHKNDINGKPFTIKPEGFTFKFNYCPNSPYFEEGLDTPADCLLIDLAQHFLTLTGETNRSYPVSTLFRNLRSKYFPETSGDLIKSAETAATLMAELRRHFDEYLPEKAPIDMNSISDTKLNQIRKTALQSEGLTPQHVDELISQGRFGRFVSINYVIDLFKLWPDLVTDGKFFNLPYIELTEDLKVFTYDELANSLQDILWLSEEAVSTLSKDNLWRLRYKKATASLNLLQFRRS